LIKVYSLCNRSRLYVETIYRYVDHIVFFFFSSRRRHTRLQGDWSSDVCSSDLGFGRVLELSLSEMLADIRNDLGEFGVVFDHWSSERALADSGAIDHALAVLEARGRLQRRDGALWFRASEFGDEKDRVVVRENGQKTYFASDI